MRQLLRLGRFGLYCLWLGSSRRLPLDPHHLHWLFVFRLALGNLCLNRLLIFRLPLEALHLHSFVVFVYLPL